MIRADVIVPLLSPALTVKINGAPARMVVSRQQSGRDYSVCEFEIDAEPGPVHSLAVEYHHPRAALRGTWNGGTF